MPHPKNRGGRPRVYDLDVVEKLARIAVTDQMIADTFRVSMRTVERWRKIPEFRAAVRRGEAKGRLEIRAKQIEVARQGDTRMLIWLAKKYLGQSESGPRHG